MLMETLLKILEVKKQEVAAAKSVLNIAELKSKCRDMIECRGFYRTLAQGNTRGINVIAEIKKASPSAGLIRADFDPAKLAADYQTMGAQAISILTDEFFFQGSLKFLPIVKANASIPVLRKDFIVDAYQLYEARAAGADAVLLIAEALPGRQLGELLDLAVELGLDVLLEVHEQDSLMRVLDLVSPDNRHCLLGVNNRNLKTMTVDLATSESLAPLLKDRIAVSESGIKERKDVERIITAGYNTVLIGETLMRSPDIAAKFNQLFNAEQKD